MARTRPRSPAPYDPFEGFEEEEQELHDLYVQNGLATPPEPVWQPQALLSTPENLNTFAPISEEDLIADAEAEGAPSPEGLDPQLEASLNVMDLDDTYAEDVEAGDVDRTPPRGGEVEQLSPETDGELSPLTPPLTPPSALPGYLRRRQLVVARGRNPYGPLETSERAVRQKQRERKRRREGAAPRAIKKRIRQRGRPAKYVSPVGGKMWWQLLGIGRATWSRWSEERRKKAMTDWARNNANFVDESSFNASAGRLDISTAAGGFKGEFINATRMDKSGRCKQKDADQKFEGACVACANLVQVFLDDGLLWDVERDTVYCRAPVDLDDDIDFHPSAYVPYVGPGQTRVRLQDWCEGLKFRTKDLQRIATQAFPHISVDKSQLLKSYTTENWIKGQNGESMAKVLGSWLSRAAAYVPDSNFMAFDDGVLSLGDGSFMDLEELNKGLKHGHAPVVAAHYHRGVSFEPRKHADPDRPIALPPELRSIFVRNYWSQLTVFYFFAFVGMALQWRDIKQDAFMFLLGESRSGKSCLLALYERAFGGSAKHLSLSPGAERFELAQLADSRRGPFVNFDVSNTKHGGGGSGVFNRQLLLKITSAEEFTTDVKNKEMARVIPKTHWVAAGNSFPSHPLVEDSGQHAVANRMFLFLLPTPADGDNPEFKERIKTRVPAFLALALRCYQAAQEMWGGVLPMPARAHQAPAQMRLAVEELTGVGQAPGKWDFQSTSTFRMSPTNGALWKHAQGQGIPAEVAETLALCIDFGPTGGRG